MFKFNDIYKYFKLSSSTSLYIFLFLVLFLGYVVPVIIYRMPTGTDAFTHIFFSREMESSESISAFYQICNEKGYTDCDYPFGLWLFGSIASKVTNVPLYTISYILPLLLLFLTVGIYFAYSRLFLKNDEEALIAVTFLLSMPIVAISILSYSSSVFAIPLLLLILYFTFDEHIHLIKRIALIALVLFVLSITHTGTYIFLFSFSFAYLILAAALWGRLDYKVYSLIASLLIIYTISMSYFPYVQPQYIDKATLVITVGEWISSKTGIWLVNELSKVFYVRVFVEKGVVDAVLWSALVYMACDLIVIIRSKLSISNDFVKNLQVGIPLIGSIEKVSHSVVTTPFWIGPIQTVLSLFGFFVIDNTGRCIFLSVLMVSILPGALHTGPTGALREIEYFLVILPIISSAGLTFLESKTKFLLKGKISRIAYYFALFLIFAALIITPIVGNIYYRPGIAGEQFEKNGLIWLRDIGSSDDGTEGVGYRDMISIYAEKLVPSSKTVSSGTDIRELNKYLFAIYTNRGSELAADNLYMRFKVVYLLTSERVLRNMIMNTSNLTIDSNMKLDKLYSSTHDFAIYQYIKPKYPPVSNVNKSDKLDFDERYPIIKDAGTTYYVEGKSYKILLGKTSPIIKYLGGAGINFVEGEINDRLTLYFRGGPKDQEMNVYSLPELNYSINAFDNEIEYSTILTGANTSDKWSTFKMKYTFYQNSIKREIIAYNDWLGSSDMEVGSYTTFFSPLPYFKFFEKGSEPEVRRVYPVQDNVRLNRKFDTFFISDGSRGIYIKYLDTAPYPDTIDYRGSLLYNLSFISFGSKYAASDSKSVRITQLISLGNEEAASKNVDLYSSVSVYPYPEGRPPIIIVSYLNSLNTSIERRLNISLQTYSKYLGLGVKNFVEGVGMRDEDINFNAMNLLSTYGTKVILFESVYRGTFDSAVTQMEKISKAINNSKLYTSYYALAQEEIKFNKTYKQLVSFVDVYNNSRAKEFECKLSIGIDRFPCVDFETCWRACYTPVCQQVKIGIGGPFIEYVWALANSSSYIDSNLSAFNEKLNSISDWSSRQEMDEFVGFLDNVIDESEKIENNAILDPSVIGFCYPADYNLTPLTQSKTLLLTLRDMLFPLFPVNDTSERIFNISSEGIILEFLRYNLDTIKVLQDNNVSFAIVDVVGSPSYYLYDEGLRHPESAYYMGDNTGIILFPVSGPTTVYMDLGENFDEYVSSWESTLNSVIKNDDIAVFLWESNNIDDEKYYEGIGKVVEYANKNGMKFSNPANVTKHYKLLDNIYATISKSSDSAKLKIVNYNLENVSGVAFKLEMPTIEGGCPYRAKGAAVARIAEDNLCKVYITLDLVANSETSITVEPSIEKKLFKIELAEYPSEGDLSIVIKDTLNNCVSDATLSLGGVAKKTDMNGTATFTLRRSNYTLLIEKPGFVSLTREVEVRGRIYLLERISPYIYVIIVFILAVVYYEAKKKFHHMKSIK